MSVQTLREVNKLHTVETTEREIGKSIFYKNISIYLINSGGSKGDALRFCRRRNAAMAVALFRESSRRIIDSVVAAPFMLFDPADIFFDFPSFGLLSSFGFFGFLMVLGAFGIVLCVCGREARSEEREV